MIQKNIINSNAQTKVPCFGVRHIQYCMLFLVMMISYGIRSILSVGIYAMTSTSPPDPSIPTYPDWEIHKNVMLSSFFWGYICLQIGAGQLATKYGPKYFIGTACFVSGLFCVLVPIFGAHFGYQGVIACRVITGFAQGFIFPCVHALISTWAPLQDRAKIGTFAYAGGPLGNVIAMPITGWISASSFGWPVVFYLYGALGISWAVLWYIIGYDSPSKHPNISFEETNYIQSGIQTAKKEHIPTPWKSIFTSVPFWAILITHCGQNFGFWTLLTEIPSYMQKILNFEIGSNSTLSALPYLVNWLLSLVMSPIADYLIVHHVSVGASRKIFNSIGLFIPAIALFGLGFIGKEQTVLAVILLVVAVGFNSAVYSGYNVNHIDLSPAHAATLMGLTNSISNIFSLISPLVVDLLEIITGYEETEKKLWTLVFSLAAIIYIAVGVVFIFAGSGECQVWNNPPQNKIEEKKEKQANVTV